MRNIIRRCACVLLCAILLVTTVTAYAVKDPTPLQECHKVKLTKHDTTHDNKSVVRIWQAETVNENVNSELDALTQAFADELGNDLPAAVNKGEKNSRLDVEIRYSRTGLTWMSFLVQARTTFHRDLTGQQIAARTYNMVTGEQILLEDIFDDDSEGWDVLSDAVRTQAAAYFPDLSFDEELLEQMASREGLSQLDFTLHGMSLVFHIPAEVLYPGHFSLMEITLMYPSIRPFMTEEAQVETDNLTYYNTVALTYDDGPKRTNTTLVLNELMIGGARATFFALGNRITPLADLIQKEHDNGHAVASHNWNHGDVRKINGSRLRSMVSKVNEAMIGAIGIPTRYDRVPYGLYNQMIKAKVGWPLIQWSLDTYDWRGKSPKAVLSTVGKEISDGDIILMHDIKDNTPNSTALIIPYLAGKGYIFLTVDEMFAKDGVELQPDTVYYRCVDGKTTKKER